VNDWSKVPVVEGSRRSTLRRRSTLGNQRKENLAGGKTPLKKDPSWIRTKVAKLSEIGGNEVGIFKETGCPGKKQLRSAVPVLSYAFRVRRGGSLQLGATGKARMTGGRKGGGDEYSRNKLALLEKVQCGGEWKLN